LTLTFNPTFNVKVLSYTQICILPLLEIKLIPNLILMGGISYYISKKYTPKQNMEIKGREFTKGFFNFLVLTSTITYGRI